MAVRLMEKSLGSIALLLHKDLLVADEMKVFYTDSEYAKFSIAIDIFWFFAISAIAAVQDFRM